MNVYKVAWINQGNPHSAVGVAESPSDASAWVKALDEANHIGEVSELFTNVQTFGKVSLPAVVTTEAEAEKFYDVPPAPGEEADEEAEEEVRESVAEKKAERAKTKKK